MTNQRVSEDGTPHNNTVCITSLTRFSALGMPAYLRDVKVAWKAQTRTHPFQLRPLNGAVFQTEPYLIQGPRVLAETTVGGLRRLQLLVEVCGQLNRKPARERGLPATQLPCIAMFLILAALNEGGVDLD